MTKTKEQLIEEITKLKISNETYSLKDGIIRREFAKAFDWYKDKGSYNEQHRQGEPKFTTWEEIFVELGKVLAARNFRDFEGNLSELECKITELEKRIYEDKSFGKPNQTL